MFNGVEIEAYRPGQQKTPLILLSILAILGYYASYQATEHVKTHMINLTWPIISPILDEHFYFDDALLHRVMRHYHPVLLQEYVWLLVARWFLGFVYALWGVELLSRTYCVVFHEKSLLRRYPLQLLPFLVGALEVVANCLVIAIIAGHPFHPHWLVNIAGFLTLIKHTTTVVCWLLGLLAVVIGFKTGFNDRKLE